MIVAMPDIKIFCKWCLIIATTLITSAVFAADSRPKIALVIGNADYSNNRVVAAKNDAHAMAKTLKNMGFVVTKLINADKNDITLSLINYADQLSASGGIGFFYYSGNALQHQNTNYLLPIGAKINDADDFELEAIALDQLLKPLNKTVNNFNVVVVDASRPLQLTYATFNNGLAKIDEIPENTLISFASQPGTVVIDSPNVFHSLFSTNLQFHMKNSTAALTNLFTRVQKSVAMESEERQIPWFDDSILPLEKHYLVGKILGLSNPEEIIIKLLARSRANIRTKKLMDFFLDDSIGITEIREINLERDPHSVEVEKIWKTLRERAEIDSIQKFAVIFQKLKIADEARSFVLNILLLKRDNYQDLLLFAKSFNGTSQGEAATVAANKILEQEWKKIQQLSDSPAAQYDALKQYTQLYPNTKYSQQAEIGIAARSVLKQKKFGKLYVKKQRLTAFKNLLSSFKS